MPNLMRAKFYCTNVEKSDDNWHSDPYEKLYFQPVVGEGSEENKSFSKYTPSGYLEMVVTNEQLHGKINQGDEFYLDFIPVTKEDQ